MRISRQALGAAQVIFLLPCFLTAESAAPRMNVLQSLLGVPTDMAVVKEACVPHHQTHLQYVLIEDAHESPEAQGKIAAIILYGHRQWGSRQAYMEGAFGPIGPPPFPIFTPERGERGILELLQEGLFSAGELAAALASQLHEPQNAALRIDGMDCPALYRAQLETFEDLTVAREAALRDLNRSGASVLSKETTRRLIELRMSPKAYHYYLQHKPKLVLTPTLIQAVHDAEQYYRLTDRRSESFVKTVQHSAGSGPTLLVMGGFHIPAMAQALRARSESYIVLSPRLTHSGRHQLYEQCLSQTLHSLRQFQPNKPTTSAANFLQLSLAHRLD